MKKCAFLTLENRGNFVIDDEAAVQPLSELGWHVSTLPWRQTDRHWSDFDVVIIRSTWDYWENVPEFLSTLEQIDGQTRLANPLTLVRWNIEKTYLRDLAGNRGIAIVPTLWVDSLQTVSFDDLQEKLSSRDIVIKPTVGANGENVIRVSADDTFENKKQAVERYRNRACMVQPFIAGILIEGEYSLFFFNGVYSHAVSKVPAKGEFRSQEERGAQIRMCSPGDNLLNSAQRAIDALELQPLYARVDLVRGPLGEWLVMELELIEPSMYLRTAYDAAGDFAAAIDHWVSYN
jgi:glutathione synthase/RimK-type ligase-like ATP-grasp enzyme